MREKGGARAHHNAGAFLGGRRPPHASHGRPGVSSVELSNQSDGRARPGPAVGLPNHPPTPNCERAKRKEKRKPPPPCAPSPVPLPHVLAVLPVLDDPARIAGVPLRHGACCVSQKGRRRRRQRESRCKKKNCYRSLAPPHALTLFFFFAPLPSTPSTPPTPTMLTIRAAARPAPMVAARPAVRRAAARGVVLARADPKSPLEAAIDEAKETCADGSTSECAVAWDTVRVRRKMGGVERERGRENCLARPLHCVGGGWAGRAAGRGAACRPSPPPPSPTFFPEGECACAASSARARRPRALQMPAHARAQGRTRARLGLGVGGPRPDPPVRPPFPPRAGCLAHTARPPLARSGVALPWPCRAPRLGASRPRQPAPTPPLGGGLGDWPAGPGVGRACLWRGPAVAGRDKATPFFFFSAVPGARAGRG